MLHQTLRIDFLQVVRRDVVRDEEIERGILQFSFFQQLHRLASDFFRRHCHQISRDHASVKVVDIRKTIEDRRDNPGVRHGFVIKSNSFELNVIPGEFFADRRFGFRFAEFGYSGLQFMNNLFTT